MARATKRARKWRISRCGGDALAKHRCELCAKPFRVRGLGDAWAKGGKYRHFGCLPR